MKRRNLIASLLAGIGVMFTGRGTASASPMGPRPSGQAFRGNDAEGQAGPSDSATVRVIYADAANASWDAVTNGGILVAGATAISGGHLNLRIIRDAVKAIVAAGGPTLSRSQVALFGGQTST